MFKKCICKISKKFYLETFLFPLFLIRLFHVSFQSIKVHATCRSEALREHADAMGTDQRCKSPLPHYRGHYVYQWDSLGSRTHLCGSVGVSCKLSFGIWHCFTFCYQSSQRCVYCFKTLSYNLKIFVGFLEIDVVICPIEHEAV